MVRPLIHRDLLEPSEIDELVEMGKPTPQALRDHAMELENKLDITIDDEEVEQIITIGDIINIVESKL